jgi:drug/metabolite transporter (DMT)-like permease
LARLTPVAQGILLMLGAIFLFSAMDATAKMLMARYDPIQVVWARYAGMMAVVALVLAPRLGSLLRTRHIGLQLLRSAFLFAATYTFFTAISRMDIAAATAVMQVHPMLLMLGAAIVLREGLGPRRIFGIMAALIGALIVIRPGSEVFTVTALLPLTCHAVRSESERDTVKRAGQRGVLLSRPAGALFQPSRSAVLRCELLAERNGRSNSRQVDSESPRSRAPGTLPVDRSMSSSKSARRCSRPSL